MAGAPPVAGGTAGGIDRGIAGRSGGTAGGIPRRDPVRDRDDRGLGVLGRHVGGNGDRRGRRLLGAGVRLRRVEVADRDQLRGAVHRGCSAAVRRAGGSRCRDVGAGGRTHRPGRRRTDRRATGAGPVPRPGAGHGRAGREHPGGDRVGRQVGRPLGVPATGLLGQLPARYGRTGHRPARQRTTRRHSSRHTRTRPRPTRRHSSRHVNTGRRRTRQRRTRRHSSRHTDTGRRRTRPQSTEGGEARGERRLGSADRDGVGGGPRRQLRRRVGRSGRLCRGGDRRRRPDRGVRRQRLRAVGRRLGGEPATAVGVQDGSGELRRGARVPGSGGPGALAGAGPVDRRHEVGVIGSGGAVVRGRRQPLTRTGRLFAHRRSTVAPAVVGRTRTAQRAVAGSVTASWSVRGLM